MHAVILCHNHAALPPALLEKRPLALMPVGERPLLQHMVESLVRGGITAVTLVVAEGSHAVSSHFGGGLRWGVPIALALERGFTGIGESLSRLVPGLPERTLVCSRLVLTDLDIAGCLAAETTRDAPRLLADASGAPTDLLLLGPADVATLPPGLRSARDLAGASHIRLEKASSGHVLAVDDLASYFEANRRWVRGETPFGDADASAPRLGRRCRVDQSARLSPPVAVGPHASIGADCQIGPETVIGEAVIVDTGAQVEKSVVWPGTYIGPDLTVRESIVAEDLVVSPAGTVLAVPDPFLLGSGAHHGIQDMLSGGMQKILAGLGLVLASPVLLPAWLVSLQLPGVFVTHRLTGQFVPTDLRGGKALKPVCYRTLTVGPPAVRHLPALWDVLRGDVRLVGVEALPEEEAEALRGTWQDLRFSRPPGLIHPWHALGIDAPTEEEKRVMENVYAHTWSLKEDCKILVQSLRALLPRPSRRRHRH